MTPAHAEGFLGSKAVGTTPTMRLLALNSFVDEYERFLRSTSARDIRDSNEIAKRKPLHHSIECTGGLSEIEIQRELKVVQERARKLVLDGPAPLAKPKPKPRKVAKKGSQVQEGPKVFDTIQAAAYLGIPRGSVYSLETKGALQRLPNLGHKIMFSKSELDRFAREGGR